MVKSEKIEQYEKEVDLDDLIEDIENHLGQCSKCKMCTTECPLYEKWYDESPMGKLQAVNAYLKHRKGIENEEIDPGADIGEILYSCTNCLACENICAMYSADVNIVDIIDRTRQYLVETSHLTKHIPEDVLETLEGIDVRGNPWGGKEEERGDWAADLDLPKSGEVLFYAGCTSSYDDRTQESARAYIQLMKEQEENLAYLGNEEICCGEPALRLGDVLLFEDLVEENIEKFEDGGYEKLVTPCPHGYDVFKNEYKDYSDFDVEVLHTLEYIDQEVDYEDITIDDKVVTYQDPCFLGRRNDIYDLPRKILKEMCGDYREMEHSEDMSICCGGGGGYMWFEPEDGVNPAIERIDEAIDVGADILAVACPYCLLNFEDAVRIQGKEEELEVLSMAELITRYG